MRNIEAMREKLRANKNEIKLHTVEECKKDPEIAWDILSTISNPGTKNKDTGEISKAAQKAKKLFEPKTIGVKSRKTKDGKLQDRSDIQSIRTMCGVYGKVLSLAIGEEDSTYVKYYSDLLTTLDDYAVKVVEDMAEARADFFANVSEIEQTAKAERAENLKKARDAYIKKANEEE